ncbi:MAG: phosphoribosylanthranilate isomerase [Gemmatimonadetes bacterium]|nr:phosphoribosylanthranilate isomerase [Gemmatimonadota bacterium]
MAVDAKICGLTRPADAALAAAHGASRLGVIFAGGPRQRTPVQAREIVAAADGVPVLGVFGTQSVEEILAIAGAARLAGAQLHGPSSVEVARRLRAEGLEVWRVARVPAEGPAMLVTLSEEADLVLLEPRLAGEPLAAGGRGVAIALPAAREARQQLPPMIRVGLAGGLTPETLAAAIRLVGPDLVDVSSGVEGAPGIKDPARLIRFLEIARDAHPAA